MVSPAHHLAEVRGWWSALHIMLLWSGVGGPAMHMILLRLGVGGQPCASSC